VITKDVDGSHFGWVHLDPDPFILFELGPRLAGSGKVRLRVYGSGRSTGPTRVLTVFHITDYYYFFTSQHELPNMNYHILKIKN